MAAGRSSFAVKRGAAPALLTCVFLVPALSSPMAQQDELVKRGRFLFRVYCQNCHGEAGRGDGPTAEMMKIAPTDLTRIRRDNEGEFPFDRIYRTIDGRQEVRGHGSAGMPVWGLAFQELDRDVNQEDEVRGKILQLIEFLESIQE
jgi:mono/diheme cytochrome c family protein